MLSGRRNAIISSKQNVAFYSSNDVNSIKIAQLEPRVRVKLEKCKKDWCKLTIDKMCGWVERKYIWGIHEQENF
jgi:SH3-like domain-containing protein